MKHFLVHVDASPRSAVRLALAQQLATQQSGRLTAFYGVMPGLLVTPWGLGEGMAYVAAQLSDWDAEHRGRAQSLVRAAAARSGLVAPQWMDGGQAPYWALLQAAPYADVLVMGQPDPADTQTGAWPADLVPGVLCDGGRPLLVVPRAGEVSPAFRRPWIAWNASREAARAWRAALPWLRAAERVHVALDEAHSRPDFDHAGALRQGLLEHGVEAPVEVHRIGPGDAGEVLLGMVTAGGADLLVMGGYGHSRAREWVLGGATRHVLQHASLPVLMSH